jgi:hypothetical protein
MAKKEPEYIVEGIAYDREHHVEMAVLTNGRRFHIDFRPTDLREPGQSSPSKAELEFLALVREVDDMCVEEDPDQSSEEASRLMDKDNQSELENDDNQACDGTCWESPLETWILQPFIQRHIFQDMAPAASKPLLSTLQDRIDTPTLSFTLKSANGELTPVQFPTSQRSLEWYSRSAFVSGSLYWSECISVRPEDVFMMDKSHSQNPNLVSFQGRKCWFKAIHAEVPDTVYAREIDTLVRIEKAGLLNRIRVPRLTALVMSKKEGFVQGLLLDAISDRGTVLERRDNPVALRKRWYNDVAWMLNLLHSAGIVWGDIKPENMLVDEDDNVWLIDFGGGMTDGWVDDENMETKEGDLQGLARFKEFLDLK